MSTATPALQFDAVTAGYRNHLVLKDLSLTVNAGECVALLGPNGVGKTTCIQVATNRLPCQSGEVRLFGEPVTRLAAVRRARKVGVVTQELSTPMAFTVGEMVMMGRTAWLGRWTAPAAHDHAAVAEAMEMTDTQELATRAFPSLSAGERQRVAVAMALAGEPRLLLLDAATAHLDLARRMEIVRLIRRISAARQLAVVAVVHDLNLAAEYFPRLVLLAEGRVAVDGSPGAVLDPALLQRVYGCEVTVQRDPLANCLRVFPRFRE